jgi:hypothetical protein
MPETTTYSGSCHCGKVRYEVGLELREAMECNCSICARKGSKLAFVPADRFTLRSGEGDLRDYQFGKKHTHHLFCTTCGISSFCRGAGPDGKPMVAINVRCLEGVDLQALPVKHFDGKSR